MINGFGYVYPLGAFGALVFFAFQWYRIVITGRSPKYLKRPLYWVTVVIIIAASGFFSTIEGCESISRWKVIFYGFSAPHILQNLLFTARAHKFKGKIGELRGLQHVANAFMAENDDSIGYGLEDANDLSSSNQKDFILPEPTDKKISIWDILSA